MNKVIEKEMEMIEEEPESLEEIGEALYSFTEKIGEIKVFNFEKFSSQVE